MINQILYIHLIILFIAFCPLDALAQVEVSLCNEPELQKVKINQERQSQKSVVRVSATYDDSYTHKKESLMVDSIFRERRSVAENKEIHFIKNENTKKDSTMFGIEINRQTNIRRTTKSDTEIKYSKD